MTTEATELKVSLGERLRAWLRQAKAGGRQEQAAALVRLLEPGLAGGWHEWAQADPWAPESWDDPVDGMDIDARRELLELARLAREHAQDGGQARTEQDALVVGVIRLLRLVETEQGSGEPGDRLLYRREAAKRLCISERQLDYLRKAGRITASKMGRRVGISEAEIERFMASSVEDRA